LTTYIYGTLNLIGNFFPNDYDYAGKSRVIVDEIGLAKAILKEYNEQDSLREKVTSLEGALAEQQQQNTNLANRLKIGEQDKKTLAGRAKELEKDIGIVIITLFHIKYLP
jgi:hypothetical protein